MAVNTCKSIKQYTLNLNVQLGKQSLRDGAITAMPKKQDLWLVGMK